MAEEEEARLDFRADIKLSIWAAALQSNELALILPHRRLLLICVEGEGPPLCRAQVLISATCRQALVICRQR